MNMGAETIQFGDAVVERYEHGDGEEDRYRKDDCGHKNEETGGGRHRAMLEGRAEYVRECKSVPERHRFAEHPGQQSRCFSVGLVAQFPYLWVDKCGYGELVAR
ncbi:MAG: hypothetical protein ACRD3K_03160 [Edaphobacter sp.]